MQAEEDAALASMLASHVSVGDQATRAREHATFAATVEDAVSKVKHYEDELAQAMALSVMDLDALRTRAQEGVALSTLLDEQPQLMEEDALAMEILNWFKLTFFKWVDQPECSLCHRAGTTDLTAMAAATVDEASYGASRVEVYRCRQCQGVTRFPRYNDPLKLLETRRGRCGEWANCFALCCRAAGLEIRLALDFEDHVWVEYYSNAMARWIHMDACEAAYDKPLLYEAGWGKQMSYVIAVGVSGVADVTKRYTKKFESLLPRRSCSEAWVDSYLAQITASLRSSLSKDLVNRLVARDAKDAASIQAASENSLGDENSLPGRQTGSSDWIASRGEDGISPSKEKSGEMGQMGQAQPRPPRMRYRWARDGGAGDMDGSRICGGVVRASGENSPHETVECAFDGKGAVTKWLDFNGCKRDTAWLEYRMLPCDDPVTLDRYALTSANDAEERDPSHIVLEAWDEEGDGWGVVEERKDIRFSERGARLEFVIQGTKPRSRRYRLRIINVRDPQIANSVQLGGWDLYRDSCC